MANKKDAVRNMEAFLSLNAPRSVEEEEEDREYEERKAKIDEYLSTMDPRRREFEEKKPRINWLPEDCFWCPGLGFLNLATGMNIVQEVMKPANWILDLQIMSRY